MFNCYGIHPKASFLLEFLKGKPTAYINKMQDFLFNEFDIQTSPSTIRRTL